MTSLKKVESRLRKAAQTAAELPTTKEVLARLNSKLNQEGFTVNGEVVKVRGYSMVSCMLVSAYASVGGGTPMTVKTAAVWFSKAAATAGFDSSDRVGNPGGDFYNIDTKEGILQVHYNVVGGGYSFHYTKD